MQVKRRAGQCPRPTDATGQKKNDLWQNRPSRAFGESYGAGMSSTQEVLEAPQKTCPHRSLCPLSRVQAGDRVRIKQLLESPGVTNRLRELGFCEEQTIRLVTRQATFICQVCNARLAISARLADFILVEPATLPVAA